MSDDPANPFAIIEQVAAVPTDCGAHTITAFALPGCQPASGLRFLLSPAAGTDLRPGERPAAGESALHEQISVIEVPLLNAAASAVIAEPPVSYPGDPDASVREGETKQLPERGVAVDCGGQRE